MQDSDIKYCGCAANMWIMFKNDKLTNNLMGVFNFQSLFERIGMDTIVLCVIAILCMESGGGE